MTTLSKSKYLAGCQCPKRLWLACFEPELATEAGAADRGQLEVGQEIGRHARQRVGRSAGIYRDDELDRLLRRKVLRHRRRCALDRPDQQGTG